MIDPLAKLGGQELVDAVSANIKPTCYVTSKVTSNLPYKRVILDGLENIRYAVYVYYRPGLEGFAKRVVQMLKTDRQFTDDEHREFGLLMGYSPENIEKWIAQLRRNEQAISNQEEEK